MANRSKKSSESTDNPIEWLQQSDTRMRPTPPAADPPVDVRRYTDILDVAVSLASTLDLRAILNNIVDGIIRVTGCERGFLMLRETDGAFSMFTGRYKDRREWDERGAREISRTVTHRVAETHEPFVAVDVAQVDELRQTDSIQTGKIRAVVGLPLLYQESLIGVIYADSQFPIPTFLESDRSVLQAFGAQAALAIENARRHGELLDHGARLEEQNLSLRQQLSREFAMSGLISKSKRMLEVFETVHKIAPHDLSVLLRGESGTGKEGLARAIHDKSHRADRPFHAINSGGIPRELVESILFGHVKGAFTGADVDKRGLFEIADGGTLFLDEIGDMPLDTQPKLLRALQQKEITRVGEEGRVRKADVRIITATHLDLPQAVKEGKFRADLFFRLNVVPIYVPPLRERPEDIIPLAEYFLSSYAAEKGVPAAELSKDARGLLLSHPWTGNVRELKSAMELGIAFQDERHMIHAADIERYLHNNSAGAMHSTSPNGDLRTMMDDFEQQVIRRVLAEKDQNVTKAAEVLGISRQQLHTKIKKYKIATRPE